MAVANYFVIPLVTLAVATAGSVIVGREVNIWYVTVKKPSWTPAGGVIGAVWTLVYTLIASSALIVWNVKEPNTFTWVIMGVFIVNGILNVLWTYLFFGKHRMRTAFFETLALEATVVALIALIWGVSEPAAWLLVPYLVWVAFAAVLNYRVWLLNQ